MAWLTPDEKAWIEGELAKEAARIGEPVKHGVPASLRNPEVLLLAATGLLCGRVLRAHQR